MRRFVPFLLVCVVALGAVACGPTDQPNILVSSPDDKLLLSKRLVFSTVDERLAPAKAVTLTNNGDQPLDVTASLGGTNPTYFRFAVGQATSFTVQADTSATVAVEFVPPSPGPFANSSTYTATLDLTSNDPDTPVFPVALSGLNSAYYEGSGEPRLQQIVNALGYGTTTNTATYRPRLPVGDELMSPYWRRVDTNQPVSLIPLARYSTRTQGPTGAAGWFPNGNSSARTIMMTFPGCGSGCVNGNPLDPNESGGQNQKLLPSIAGAGGVGSGTTTFAPTSLFGLFAGGSMFQYSDDGLNGTYQTHNLRAFPAESAGLQIPNAWIVGDDVGTTPWPIDSTKNDDYQDYVFLLVNAEPELTTTGPAPGSGELSSEFNSNVIFTQPDKDGEGTGFTSVQASSAGLQSGLIDVDTAAGRMYLTSTDGSNSGGANTQANALQENFDGTRATFRSTGRVVGPLTNLTAASQHVAVFLGPDNNNFFKVEIEYYNGAPTILVYAETTNVYPALFEVGPTLDPTTATTVDLRIEANPDLRTLQAQYRLNSDTGAYVNVGTAFAPPDSMRWFSRQSQSGVFVSDQGGGGSFVGTWERFTIAP